MEGITLINSKSYMPLLERLNEVSNLKFEENIFTQQQVFSIIKKSVEKKDFDLADFPKNIFFMQTKNTKYYLVVEKKDEDVYVRVLELDEKVQFNSDYRLVLPNQWIELYYLRPGALFETVDGVKAVKSEYFQCILLSSGEHAHFEKGARTLVKEVYV